MHASPPHLLAGWCVYDEENHWATKIEVVALGRKGKAAMVATFGVAAFAAGWAKGHVSGIRNTLDRVETLRYVAECRAEDGEKGDVCQWVYSPEHPRVGKQFGGGSVDEVGFIERDLRNYRPFAGLPLLETIELDVARPLPRANVPSEEPAWWEEEAGDPYLEEYREHLQRENERVRRRRWMLRRLRHGPLGGLRIETWVRFGPSVGDGSLFVTIEVHNDSPKPIEVGKLRLTLLYNKTATEWLLGRRAPTALLDQLVDGDPPGPLPVVLSPDETLHWSGEIRNANRRLAGYDMRTLRVYTLPRPDGLLYRILPSTGMAGQIAMERLRELTHWNLAVELVDVQGKRCKTPVEFVPA